MVRERERAGGRFPIRKRGCCAKGVFGYRLPWLPFITHISDYFIDYPGGAAFLCSRASLNLMARQWRFGEPLLCSNCDLLLKDKQHVVKVRIVYNEEARNADHYWLRICCAISNSFDRERDKAITYYYVDLCFKCFIAQAKRPAGDYHYELVNKKTVTVHGIPLQLADRQEFEGGPFLAWDAHEKVDTDAA